LAVLEQCGTDGRYRSVVLHPDGTLVPVTAASEDRQMPVLSPQGDLVAFQLLQPHPITGQPRWEVFTVRADGTGRRQVTGGLVEGGPRLVEPPLGAGNRWPSWSPDGRRLAFSCSGPTGLPVICTARADGSGRRGIMTEGQGFYQPSWSPDGRSIAAKREVAPGLVGLWLLNPDGGAATSLPVPTLDPRGVRLSWSSDGRKLVYAQVEDAPSGLVIVDVASGEQRIVPTPSPARFPIVCGRDQVLYLESSRGLDDPELRTGPLVLVGEDGTRPTVVLPADPGVEHLPSSCAAG
jgi:dipeptidyl aminopeptidase/acylaminoacyl peptidase